MPNRPPPSPPVPEGAPAPPRAPQPGNKGPIPMPPNVCRRCEKANDLDQWYEVPNSLHLICPTCAQDEQYARPAHIQTVTDRLVQAYQLLHQTQAEKEELEKTLDSSPDLGKQLRKLNRTLVNLNQASDQTARMVTEMVNNLSPRWVVEVEPGQERKAREVITRMSEEAGPGAIMKVTPEEMEILKKVHKL